MERAVWHANGRGLAPVEAIAAREFVRRVIRDVPAELIQASLFGSKARGEGRPDSDVDVLLVFRRLPWDREPQATQAEAIAEEVAARSGVPVTTWSVSMVDLARGQRTPMLVDALTDSVPIWVRAAPLPAPPFTPEDALRCVRALLDRLTEGSGEFAAYLESGDLAAALRRARDDLVRLCTAWLLLQGETRPRRAESVRRFAWRASAAGPLPQPQGSVLAWAAGSFGPHGRDDDRPIPLPREGIPGVVATVEWLRERVCAAAAQLASARNPLHRHGI